MFRNLSSRIHTSQILCIPWLWLDFVVHVRMSCILLLAYVIKAVANIRRVTSGLRTLEKSFEDSPFQNSSFYLDEVTVSRQCVCTAGGLRLGYT